MSLSSSANLLDQFVSIPFQELGGEILMQRREIKYYFHRSILYRLLPQLSDFKVIELNNKVIHNYQSFYLDTDDYRFYHDHHNDRKRRIKIRFRDYMDSKMSFFEIKQKDNKDINSKFRCQVPFQERLLTDECNTLLKMYNTSNPSTLKHSLTTTYQRISFVNSAYTARVTIDQNILFSNVTNAVEMGPLVIMELKYNDKFRFIDWRNRMKQIQLNVHQISKYCTGICHLYPQIKSNNFHSRLRKIEKIRTLKE